MLITTNSTLLQTKSNEIRMLCNELHNCMEQIEVFVMSLNGTWQGEAEKAYASQIIYVKQQFSGIEEFFNEYATNLDKIAREYGELERQLSSKIELT